MTAIGSFFMGENMQVQKGAEVMQLFAIVSAAIFGGPMAELIGAYLLIIFASCAGAGWSLSRTAPKGKGGAVLYFVRISMTAIILTASLAQVVTHFLPTIDAQHFIAPVAFCIGLIGNDWGRVGKWVVQALRDALGRIGGK